MVFWRPDNDQNRSSVENVTIGSDADTLGGYECFDGLMPQSRSYPDLVQPLEFGCHTPAIFSVGYACHVTVRHAAAEEMPQPPGS